MENFDFSIIESNDRVMTDTTQRVSGDNTMTMSMIESDEPERLDLYRGVMQETSCKITSSVSKEELVEMFKAIPSFKDIPPSKKNYMLISHYHEVLTRHIHDQMNFRIEEHIQSAELSDKFTQLEELIKSNSASRGITAWRPSRDVEKNLRSYIMQEKMKYRDQLKDLVSAKEDAVRRLKSEVITSRCRMEKINERLQGADGKFSAIAKNVEGACKK